MFDEFLSLRGKAQPKFTMMKRCEAKRERILKLIVQFASRKNCFSLLTHHFVAFCSNFQMIWTIWNYPGCHLCHVILLDIINNPGTVFILHRERNDNKFIVNNDNIVNNPQNFHTLCIFEYGFRTFNCLKNPQQWSKTLLIDFLRFQGFFPEKWKYLMELYVSLKSVLS